MANWLCGRFAFSAGVVPVVNHKDKMNTDNFKDIPAVAKWRPLMEDCYKRGIDPAKEPWYPEFETWAIGAEGQEVLRRYANLCPDDPPVNRLINRATMRELGPDEPIQAGDILHWRRGYATKVGEITEEGSNWIGQTLANCCKKSPWTTKKPMKIWRLK